MLYTNQTNSISVQNIQRIARCRGWALTFAIFLFIYSGLLILSIIGSIGQASASSDGAISVLANLCLSALYIASGVNFCKFSNNIRSAADTLNPHQLETAMKCQAKAWMWLGISAIIYLIVTLIMLVALIAA